MDYAFRTTYREDADTYVEDRGYPHYVRRGNPHFDVLDAEFGHILLPGHTATKGEGRWWTEEGCPFLESARELKLKALHENWLQAEADATVECGGALVDANERANRDVNGLITAMEAQGVETAEFCLADNTFRTLTLAQLKAVRLAIIAHAQLLYAHKWSRRLQIEGARTFDELEAVDISFDGV